MKTKGTKTRYPGVYRIDARTYRVTGKFQDLRTGKDRWIQRLLTGVSAREAAAQRKTLMAEARAEHREEAKQVTAGEYARSWLTSKALHVDAATTDRYQSALTHAMAHFGEVYMHALRSSDIQDWIDSELRKEYAADSIRGWFRVVRTMMRDAAAALELPRDPTERIRLPEPREANEDNAFTPDELARFLDAMRALYPQHYALVTTMGFTGLRFCHVSALRWDDVDLDAPSAATLTIRRKNLRGQVGRVSRKKRAPRVYPISSELVAILSWHRDQYPGGPDAWVFPSRTGELRKATSSVSKAWQACLKAAGIERRVTPHGLRRTFTDLTRLAGVDGVVSRSLIGHTERMRQHYSHVREDEQRRAVVQTVAVVRRAARPHAARERDDGQAGAPIDPMPTRPESDRRVHTKSRPEGRPGGNNAKTAGAPSELTGRYH